MLGCWGLLPIVVPCVVLATARLGTLAFPGGRTSDRWLAGAVLLSALLVLGVELLGALQWLTRWALVGELAATTAIVSLVRRPRSKIRLGHLMSRATAPIVVVAIVSLVAAMLSAYWLPVWQWDALGYHLPYVNFALVAHGFRGVPADMPYVSTYPHNIETFMIALRAMLPDDRLVDVAQIPFALLAAVTVAGIARRLDAPPAESLAAGAAWLVVPAVFLQMPTDYVDIGSAAYLLLAIYFVLSVPSALRSGHVTGGFPSTAPLAAARPVLLGAIALGLFLGSKPSSPLATVIVMSLLVRGGLRTAGGWRVCAVAAVLVLLFGGEVFIVNVFEYGNPVWPVAIGVGRWHLPGRQPMAQLLASGAGAPHLGGTLASRVFRSWTTLWGAPAFDMRVGGLGPLFLASLPLAAETMVRRKKAIAWGVLAATLATPDPAVARYILAFPALLFAFAAPRFASLSAVARPWVGLVAGAVALVQVGQAWPGLSGEGPPLFAYARMSEMQRAEAVGADGPPTRWIETRGRVGPDESFAFDESFELPYLAWDSKLSRRAVWIPGNLPPGRVASFLTQVNARVVVASDTSPVGEWLRENPGQFLRQSSCGAPPCSVYARR